MNLWILFGGKSTEYEVSCASAYHVLKNSGSHKVEKVGITRQGNWFFTGATPEQIRDCAWEEDPSNIPVEIDLAKKCFRKQGEKLACDVVFPVLHGKNGEDGTVQGLLTLLEIPFVGSGVLASSLCMDKAAANLVLEKSGFQHVKWLRADRAEYQNNAQELLQRISSELAYPLFVKPANAGSSVGITRCKAPDSLVSALETAFQIDGHVVVEQGLHNPKEIEVAVMGSGRPVAALAGRVMSATEVYDYEAKYKNAGSYNLIPADIGPALSETIRELALQAYKVCGCSGLARVDFFVDGEEQVYINEINTLPGFTAISMFPQAFAKSGVPYAEQIDRLLMDAKRNRE